MITRYKYSELNQVLHDMIAEFFSTDNLSPEIRIIRYIPLILKNY